MISCVCVAACGGGSDTSSATSKPAAASTSSAPSTEAQAEPAPSAAAAQAWDAAKGTAHVTGKITFKGDAPKRRKIDMGSDATCGGLHAEAVLDESAIVDAHGGLQNVLVYVRKGLEGWKFSTPTNTAELKQQGCVYAPHVLGVQVGQPVAIHNNDAVTHNVHVYANKNSSFNQTQASGGPNLELKFERNEVPITFKCDIHGWMSNYVGVFDHPFFAVSAADGSFDLGQLPAGDYTLAGLSRGLRHSEEAHAGRRRGQGARVHVLRVTMGRRKNAAFAPVVAGALLLVGLAAIYGFARGWLPEVASVHGKASTGRSII